MDSRLPDGVFIGMREYLLMHFEMVFGGDEKAGIRLFPRRVRISLGTEVFMFTGEIRQ